MRQALLAVEGVTGGEVSYEPARADICYRSGATDARALVTAVEEAGFEAKVIGAN